MANEYVNKVVLGSSTLIDLTSDTVTPSTLMQGYTAHDRSGALITGTASGGGTGGVTQDAQGYLVLDEHGGGGGDDTDFANTIMRSGAITRIPDSVTSIGDYAFRGCNNLALTELPSGVTSIGLDAFRNCTSLALTGLPSGVTSIGENAFYGCENLALTELPSGMTSIGSNTFYGCEKLALTELPSGVTSIGSNAFRNCSGLRQLDAQNVATIGTYVFASCFYLTELVLRKSDTVCTLSNVNAFVNTPMRGYNGRTGTVYVPSALISTYQTATNWSTLYNAGTVTFAAIEGSEYERD